jgi:hypothetical protein
MASPGAGMGVFFLKKLNILWVRGITAFYETQRHTLDDLVYAPLVCGLSVVTRFGGGCRDQSTGP